MSSRRREMRREPACRSRLRSATGAVGGTIVAWLLTFGISAAPARAAIGHAFLSSLSEAPPGTALAEPGALAVERSSGRVFVADLGRGVIDVFSSSGSFETQFNEGGEPSAIAIDEQTHDVYVAEPFEDLVRVYAPDGKGGYLQLSEWLGANAPEEQFGEVSGVAVDNSTSSSDSHAGDLFISDAGKSAVYIFKPKPPGPEEAREGEFVASLSGGKLEEPNGVALDSATGKAYVADSSKGFIAIYGSSGAFEKKLTGSGQPEGSFFGPEGEEGNVTALAIDETSGELYVTEAQRRVVSQFNAEGTWIGWLTSTPQGALGEVRGVALASTEHLYVADATNHLIDVFGPDVVVPDAKTGAASKIAKTTAILGGVVNGDGKAAKYSFQWGETPALGQETPTQNAGGAEEKVKAEQSGLKAGATYYFRLKAENENGTNYGAIRQFEALPAVEGLATGPVQNIKPSEATLTGALDPKGTDTHYYFEWGETAAYGSKSPAPPADAGAGTEALEVKTKLAGLQPNTTYHYRLVGEDSYGTTTGEDKQFTTSGPPRISYEPPTAIGQEEATIHAKIDPDQIDTTYRFQYGETTSYGSETPAGGQDIGSGSLPVAVSASLSSLKVGTTYHFRVLAENEAGTSIGEDQTFTTVPSAPVDATFATGVSSTEATLHTQINPLGHDTTYYFQYGTEACQPNPAACANVPATPEDIGAGTEDVAREVRLTGLRPGTTYHYRVLDSNALGVTQGPERTFTSAEEQSSLTLPDNRAWEMVSPPDKGGAPVEALTREGGLILAAEDGHALTYVVNGAQGEEVQGNRSPEMQQILATRGPSGWISQDITTPSSKAKGIAPGNAPEYQFFTPDLSVALVEPPEPGAEPPLAPGVVQATPYLRDDATGSYLPLVTEADTAPGTQFGGHIRFLSATPDLTHVVIASEVALTGPGSSRGLYEWSGGQLHFVSVLPNRVTPAATPELGFYGAVLAHAISNDGSRIVWTNKEDTITRGGHLYMRDATRGETIQLDAAKGVAEPEKGSAEFQTASADGSRVFFTDRQQLTADSTAEPGQGSGKPDLYECQITEVAGKLACNLMDLTVDQGEGEHANVQGLLFGANGDGTSVYLVAQGVLSGNENGNNEKAVNGKDNLYQLRYDGSQWSTTFIATLSGEDSPEWEGNQSGNSAYLTTRVSPSGRYLAFMSAAPITGYDNIDANPAANGARAEEVYLYDAATASLRCVSCNPNGARPAGVLDTENSGEGLGLLVDRRLVWGRAGHEHWLAGNIPGWTAQTLTSALLQSRYLSDEGRLYFNSPDSLVPAAKNGSEDVYEYEPSGVGSCQSTTGGCVSLISGGNSDRESAFIEATPDGSNVFFLTEARLLAQDTDTAFDIYDARECTGISPCLTAPAAREAPCAGAEACRPAQQGQQIPGGPSGTAVFSGAGNIASGTLPAKHAAEVKKAARPLTRAQKLKRALRSCRKRYVHSQKRRGACERNAKKRYDTKHTKTKAGRNVKSGASNSRARSRGR